MCPEGLRGLVGARRKIPRAQALLGHEPQGAQGPLVQSLAPPIPTFIIDFFRMLSFKAASVVGCRFASNPIDIEENTAGHLSAAECWPLDGSFPRFYLTLHQHPMKDAGLDELPGASLLS